MIHLGANEHLTAPIEPIISCKVIGVGGAGLRLLDALVQRGNSLADFVAMHTDAQALLQSTAPRKLQIGRAKVRGLGAGGDPALGESAAQENLEEIRAECEDAQVVIVCAGLGGGTGSGAASVVAREAAKAGAVVLAVVTLPFKGEGERRREQAEASLAQLGNDCAAVICFENDRMGEITTPEAPLVDALHAATGVLVDAVYALLNLLSLPSLLHVGIDEILPLFRESTARCQFGLGIGQGDDRASLAVEQALQSPLLEKGKKLGSCGNILVHISGDDSLRFEEMQQILREISRYAPHSSQIFLGVATDPNATDEIRVAILASVDAVAAVERESGSLDLSESKMNREAGTQPAKAAGKRSTKHAPSGQLAQEELPLDQAGRGRFKDVDPTMVEGQDLDVPTYIRMRIRLK